MFYDQAGYEQPQVDQFSIDKPGNSVDLPTFIIRELQNTWNYKKRLPFLGGHPVSITKESCNAIFTTLNNMRQSPYLVCEKTDGVRYLLIIAKVGVSDLHREKALDENPPFTQCFFVSRQGLGKPITYSADVAVSHLLEPASTEMDRQKKQVIQILDGQLIKQANGQIRFLIFDALIHLGRDICELKLRDRLDCIVNFLHCNNMLGVKKHKIELRLKDFFRLTCPKFNISEFMMNKYVKCLPHQNDGLIFNHQQKQYIRGATNQGYIKWKPAHLNTVDFMIVPNQNLQQTLGKRVLDLYLAYQDMKLQRYTRQFYSFAVVSEQTYDQIFAAHQDKLMKYADKQLEMHEESQEAIVDEFNSSCIIAQCRFQATKLEERTVMSQLVKHSDEDLYSNIMKQGQEKKDRQAIRQFKNKMYDKGWKIYKLRIDKTLPNNIEVTKKIEQSIRDGIGEDELIKKNRQLLEKVRKGY